MSEKQLSRRTLLKGTGATMALPLLDAMLPGGVLQSALAKESAKAPVRMAFGLGTFPVVVKEAMGMIGLPVGPARAPVGPMSELARAKLHAALEQAGLLDQLA